MGKIKKKNFTKNKQQAPKPASNLKLSFISNPFFVFSLVTALILIAYSNIYSYPFYFDDVRSIRDNPALRDFSNYWPPSTLSNRYLGELSFALNFKFGFINPFGYHLVNVAIHIINSLLVWFLVGSLFKTPVLTNIKGSDKYKAPLALLCTLFFALHPVQTQAVTYTVQRYASMATLFYLLSIFIYIKARTSRDAKKQIVLTLLALFSAFCAMKTKEISFTIPFMVILIEWMFFCTSEGGLKPWLTQKRLFTLLPMVLTVFVIPLAMVGTGSGMGELLSSVGKAASETESISRPNYLFTQFRVVAVYLKLLFLPIGQVLDYDFKSSTSFFQLPVMLGFVLHSTLIGGGFWLLNKARKNGNALAILGVFGLFWFYGALSVESSIIPIRDIIFEHRMYLPMTGGALFVLCTAIYLFEELTAKFSKNKMDLIVFTLILATLISVLYTGLTYRRNIVWASSETLWRDVIEKSPTNPRGYNGLGYAYYNDGKYKLALENYIKSIKIKPDYTDVYNNMGIAYFKLPNSLDKSIVALKKAIELRPSHSRALNNLGVALSKKGEFEEAKELLLRAYALDKTYGRPYYNLGNIYSKTGDPTTAIEYYEKSIKVNPEYEKPYFNMSVALGALNRIDEAIEYLGIAIKIKPNYVQAHHNLGAMFFKKGDYDNAIAKFKTVLAINPKYYDSMFNLAVVYNRMKKPLEAKKWLDNTLALNPKHPGAIKMLSDQRRAAGQRDAGASF